MYGLLSKVYNEYRIRNESNIEGYRYKDKSSDCIVINIIEMLMTVIVLLALFDIYLINKLPIEYFVLILFCLYIPFFGDLLGLGICIFWILNIYDKSILFPK